MKTIQISIIAMAGAILAGCASPNWRNPNFSANEADAMLRQKAIDEGYCTQVAHGSAPMPEARAYVPTQQSYSINGTVTSYGQGGVRTSNYSGYVTPSPGASFSSGLVQGAALGAAIRARRAQDAIMRGCMIKLGWTDKPIAGETIKPPLKQASVSNSGSTQINSKNPQQNSKDADISCDQWATDIAETVDSGYRHGVDKKIVHKLAGDYITEANGSGRQRLIFASIINARYKIPLNELSSEEYPKYVRWECEQNWTGFGLGEP